MAGFFVFERWRSSLLFEDPTLKIYASLKINVLHLALAYKKCDLKIIEVVACGTG